MGKTFGKPVRVDDAASLGNVGVVLLDDGAAAVTWVEFDNGARFRVRRVEPSGARSAAKQIAGGDGRFRQRHPAHRARGRPTVVCLERNPRRRTRRAREKVVTATAAIPRMQ